MVNVGAVRESTTAGQPQDISSVAQFLADTTKTLERLLHDLHMNLDVLVAALVVHEVTTLRAQELLKRHEVPRLALYDAVEFEDLIQHAIMLQSEIAIGQLAHYNKHSIRSY